MTRRKLIGTIVFALFFMILGKNLDFVPKLSLPNTAARNAVSLRSDVTEYTQKQKGSYSVYYNNFQNNSSFGIDERQIIVSASVNKTPLIAVLYYLASKGEINLDSKITILEKDIQDYGTGSLRYEKPGGSYSLRNLAKLSLKQSDNTAAHVLGVRIGMDKIQKTIDEWGLTQTNMADNKTSNYDVYLLFRKIYNGEVTNAAHTQELLSFFTDSDFEDRLPALLPEGTIVYHKTGDAEGGVHDVGIIKNGENDYYLGVMTSDIGEEEGEAKRAIAEISKIIFERQKDK